MPSVIFDKKLFKDTQHLECGICMEPFEEGYDYITPLACDGRHFYHSDCIEEWLTLPRKTNALFAANFRPQA